MLNDFKPILQSDPLLPLLYRLIMEFLHTAAGCTHEMVMVHIVIQLIDGFPWLKVSLLEQTGLLQLCEYAIHGRQSNVVALRKDQAIHIFSSEMALFCVLEKLQNLQAR